MLRRAIALAGALFLLSGGTHPLRAQDTSLAAGKRPDLFQNTPSQLLKDLDRALDLSDEQKQKIISLKKNFETQNKAALKKLRQDVQRVRQAMQTARTSNDQAALKKLRAEARTLRQSGERLHAVFDKQLLSLLTEQQRKQYADFNKSQAISAKGKQPAIPLLNSSKP